MTAPTRAAQRSQAVDQLAEVIDAELAAAGERMQSAERSLHRARDRYARLVDARATLRTLA